MTKGTVGVTLHQHLSRRPEGDAGDANATLLADLLASGASVVHAVRLDAGFGPFGEECLVLTLVTPAGHTHAVPVGTGARVRELLLVEPDAPLVGTRSGDDDDESLRRRLRERFDQSRSRDPEERAQQLMTWLLETLDVSRGALVPCDGGLGEPLAFLARAAGTKLRSPRTLPSRILEHVVATRQPLVSADARGVAHLSDPAGSVVGQGVRGFAAIPIVLRGELLGVFYVDRLGAPRDFTPTEIAAIHAVGLDLALPVLELREATRRRELLALRDAAASRRTSRARSASPAMRPVLDRLHALAPLVDESLLLLGETGVGKEWLVRAVHEASGREGAFVAINVSALSEDLFDLELFGARRGAFTGAIDRPGRIAEAEGGTLFLDEIGDLSLRNQVRLLRFLQDRVARPLGGQAERVADVRIVAATNRPIAEMVARGEFREDLLHRFAPPVRVPPLRERREEIIPLAEEWLEHVARRRGVAVARLADDARELLMRCDWPGNVRQLQQAVGHAAATSRGHVRASHLAPLVESARTAAASASLPRAWEDFEREQSERERAWIVAALDAAGGKVQVAARAAGCPPTTFRNALARHGLIARREK